MADTSLSHTASDVMFLRHSVYIGWSDVTVIYGHDTISMMSYCAKLTGDDMSRYLNKIIESIGLIKA